MGNQFSDVADVAGAWTYIHDDPYQRGASMYCSWYAT